MHIISAWHKEQIVKICSAIGPHECHMTGNTVACDWLVISISHNRSYVYAPNTYIYTHSVACMQYDHTTHRELQTAAVSCFWLLGRHQCNAPFLDRDRLQSWAYKSEVTETLKDRLILTHACAHTNHTVTHTDTPTPTHTHTHLQWSTWGHWSIEVHFPTITTPCSVMQTKDIVKSNSAVPTHFTWQPLPYYDLIGAQPLAHSIHIHSPA